MMIYRNKKGISFVEIIVSIAIISIVILGGAQAIKYIMQTMVKDRQQIEANNFVQMIIEELKVRCVPESFLKLDIVNTEDWEGNLPQRTFPHLKGKVDVGPLLSNGQRKIVITIKFINWRDENNDPKKSEYYITLVKNTGLQPQGIISGRVVNYVTERGIPNAEVSAPSAKISGVSANCLTNEDGSFTLTGVEVGLDIPITVTKLGSHPNDMNYNPGYYIDPDIIDLATMEPYQPLQYENPNSRNDILSWTKNFNVANNIVTQIGTVYMCPMAVVRGWVREDENDDTSGIGKVLVGFGYSGNFNSQALTNSYRNSMHEYYTIGEIQGNGSTSDALYSDRPFYIHSNGSLRNGNYYGTTSNANTTYTYAVEGTNITLDMKRGDFVFFNIRPGNNTDSAGYYRYLVICGRPGSLPTVKRTDDANFEWGYLRSYFTPHSYFRPRLIVKASHCFDTTGTSTFIGPLFNEAQDYHEPLPVTRSNYRYYFYGTCTDYGYHNFNPIALALQSQLNNIGNNSNTPLSLYQSCSHGVDFTQSGWKNYETLIRWDADKLSTCYEARRRGGIRGRIIDAYTGFPVEGITVRAKAWADTSQSLSWAWTEMFSDRCPQIETDSNGEFELNNIYGMEQQYFVTGKPNTAPPNWEPFIDDFRNNCINDQTIQDYAVLRITDERDSTEYMPRLIRPYHHGPFDHTNASTIHYPMPRWAVNMGAADQGITDFGNIAMVNVNMAVTVIGRLVDASTPPNPIQNATITTLGIYGLAIGDWDNNLNMDGTNLAQVSATSDANGDFILQNVQPNFVHLNPGTASVDHVYYDWAQPRRSIRIFFIDPPTGIIVPNVHIDGNVTDISGLNNVGAGAQVYVGTLNPATNALNEFSLTTLTQTDALGHYQFDGTINGLPGNITYLEHIPADNTNDPYDNLNDDITFNPGSPQTVTLHQDIVVGDPVAEQYVLAVEKTIQPQTAIGSYQRGHTAQLPQNQTNQNNGTYTIVSGTNIVNANITLLRNYRIRLFGRVVDGEGNGLANSTVRIYQWYPYRSLGPYNTDSEGYWGDWTPAGFSGRGGAEINIPLNHRPRTWSNAGAPYWRVNVRAYPPTGLQLDGSGSYRNSDIGTEPTGWSGGIEVPWTDGIAVNVDPIILPLYYSEGQ